MLHCAENVFDSRPLLGTNTICFLLTSRQFSVTLTFLKCQIAGQRSFFVNRLLLADISLVSPDSRFIPVQQVSDLLRIMYTGSRDGDAVYQLRLCIDSNVALHAIIPLTSFLRRRHLGIAALRLILSRRRCGNNRRIDDSSLRNSYALAFQIRVDLLEERRAEALLLDHVTKLTYRSLIRSGVRAKIETNEVDHRADIVQRLFHRRIRQIKPLLQKVDAEHSLKPDRRTPVACCRVVRSNNGGQFLPRNDRLHLLQKKLPTSRSVRTFKTTGGKAKLIGHKNFVGWLIHKPETTNAKSCFIKSYT